MSSTASPSPYTVSLNVDVVCSLRGKDQWPQALQSSTPTFRYSLWTGSKVTTSAIGGEGWEVLAPILDVSAAPSVVVPPTSPPGKGAPAPDKGGAKNVGGKGGAAPVEVNKRDKAASGCLMRHRTKVENLVMDVPGALSLGEKPVVFLFCSLGEEPSAAPAAGGKAPAAAAAVPAKGGKTAPTPAATASSSALPSTTRPYAFWIPLDASALLLEGKGSVVCMHGEGRAAGEALMKEAPPPPPSTPAAGSTGDATGSGSGIGGASSTPEVVFPADVLGFPEPSTPTLPTPTLFSFLSFSISLASATMEVPPPEQPSTSEVVPASPAPPPPAAAAKGGKAGGGGAKEPPPPPPPPAPTHVPIIPPTLLAPHVRATVNPLSVTLSKGECLPGLTLPSSSDVTHMSKFLSPSQFSLQDTHCTPSYATLVFPALTKGSGSSSSGGGESITLPDAITTVPVGSAAATPASSMPLSPSGPPTTNSTSSSTFSTTSSSSSSSNSALRSSQLDLQSEVRCGIKMSYPPKRVGFTPALPPGSSLPWDTTWVVCVGEGSPGGASQWRETLECGGLEVRVHDRDVKGMERLVEKAREVKGLGGKGGGVGGAVAASQNIPPPIVAVPAPAAPVSTPGMGVAPAGGGKGSGGVSAGVVEAPSPPITPRSPTYTLYAPLRHALLPAHWPWPLLSNPRTSLFEDMVNGLVPWPLLASGEPLVSYLPAPPAPPPPAAPAAAAAATPAKGGKAAPPSSPTPVHPDPTTSSSAAAPPVRPPPDVFDVDTLLVAEVCARLEGAGGVHCHGVASLRLEGLLNPASFKGSSALTSSATAATATTAAAITTATSVRVSAPILPSQRTIRNKASENTHLLTKGELLLITPGDYARSGARVKCSATLAAPLSAHLPEIVREPTSSLSSTTAAASLLSRTLTSQSYQVDTQFPHAAVTASGVKGLQWDEVLTGEGEGGVGGGGSVRLATLSHFGTTTLNPPPSFERLVIVCQAQDDAMVLRIVTTVASFNAAFIAESAAAAAAAAGASTPTPAPPEHLPTPKMYRLSEGELDSIVKGHRDALTGIHVTDGVHRVFIVESVGGSGGGVEVLRRSLPPRPDPSTPTLLILSNPAVRWGERLYAAHTPSALTLTTVRLHTRFSLAALDPKVYSRAVTGEGLQTTLGALCTLVSGGISTLAFAYELGESVWPSAAGLRELNVKMGGELSLEDVYGRLHPAAHAGSETAVRLREATTALDAQRPSSLDATFLLSSTSTNLFAAAATAAAASGGDWAASASSLSSPPSHTATSGPTAKGARDCQAPHSPLRGETDFTVAASKSRVALSTLRSPGTIRHVPQDFLAGNIAAVASASATLGATRRETVSEEEAGRWKAGVTLDTQGLVPPGGAVHLYSSQRLNTGEWARKLQRDRLSAIPATNYTRSAHPTYNAFHINLDKERDELEREATAAHKAALLTKRGFIFPALSTREEDLVHSKAGQGISMFLGDKYVEKEESEAIEAARSRALAQEAGKPPYAVPASNPNPLGHRGLGYMDPISGRGRFGYVDPPSTAGASSSSSSSSSSGTSGRSVQESSSQFFKSVFLGGKAMREEAEAAVAEERRVHLERMVVAPPYAFAYHMSKDGTRLERSRSILRGEARKLGVVQVVGGGKEGRPPPLTHPPPSLFSTGEVFPGPTLGLETMLRPLPTPPPGSMGGTATRLLRAGFTSSGRDFMPPAEPDIITGTEDVVHNPFIYQARRTDAPPGTASITTLPTMFRGVNTDWQL